MDRRGFLGRVAGLAPSIVLISRGRRVLRQVTVAKTGDKEWTVYCIYEGDGLDFRAQSFSDPHIASAVAERYMTSELV